MKIIGLIFFTLILSFAANSAVQPIQEVFSPPADQYPSSEYTKVAVVAWSPSGYAPITNSADIAEKWKQNNREYLAHFIRQAAAAGAKLIVTPEFGTVGYPDIPELPDEEDNFTSPQQVSIYTESIGGNSTQFFSALAKELGVYIHFGMVEKDSKSDELNGPFYNTVVVINPNGAVATSYRKIQLYQLERSFLKPGDKPIIYDNTFIGPIGIIICADVYSSFPMNFYKNKVVALALSASWAQYNTGMSYFISGARSANSYLLAANQNYFPDSGIIEPNGFLQSHIRQSTGVAYGFLPSRK